MCLKTSRWQTVEDGRRNSNGTACVVRLDLKGSAERADLAIKSAAPLHRESIK